MQTAPGLGNRRCDPNPRTSRGGLHDIARFAGFQVTSKPTPRAGRRLVARHLSLATASKLETFKHPDIAAEGAAPYSNVAAVRRRNAPNTATHSLVLP